MIGKYTKNDSLIPVDYPVVGEKYHVSWGYSRGVVGVCVSINSKNKTVTLRTPKTKTLFKNPVSFSDLRHLRKNQFRIETTKTRKDG